MNFVIEDYLDDKYEERNNMIENIDLHCNHNRSLNSEDLIPLQEYIKQESSANPKMNINRTAIGNGLHSQEPPDSSLPLLDNIDPSIFYPRRLTELTPVKNESSCNNNRYSEPSRMSDSLISMIETNNFNTFGLDLPETSWILADLDNGAQNNNEELSYNEKTNVNNYLSTQYVGQRFYQNGNSTEPQIEVNSHQLLPNDHYIRAANKSENNFSLIKASSPFLYEYSTQRSPIFENPYFNDFETSQKECGEPDTTASSPSSCCSFSDDLPCLPNENGESAWVREIRVGKNNRPRGPKCWEFVLRLLQDPLSNPSLVKWEEPTIGSFRLVEKDKISAIWGNRPSKKKNGKVIKYESFARILRYHYKKGKGMVLPVSEKHLVYKFSSKVMDAYRAGKIL